MARASRGISSQQSHNHSKLAFQTTTHNQKELVHEKNCITASLHHCITASLHHCITASLILALSFFAAHAQAETTKCKAITKLPYEIKVAGVYCLKKNLTMGVAGSAISINEAAAAGTVIDLNGFTLSSSATVADLDTSTGIGLGAPNIRIHNGTIKKFGTGIWANGNCRGCILEDLILDSNLGAAISVQWVEGIIRHNLITNTGGVYAGTPNASATGIDISGGDTSVLDNTIIGVTGIGTGSGTGIKGGHRSVVSNNTISNTSTCGICLQSGNSQIVSSNRITQPGSYGIITNGTYMDNIVVGATTASYSGGTAAGSTNY